MGESRAADCTSLAARPHLAVPSRRGSSQDARVRPNRGRCGPNWRRCQPRTIRPVHREPSSRATDRRGGLSPTRVRRCHGLGEPALAAGDSAGSTGREQTARERPCGSPSAATTSDRSRVIRISAERLDPRDLTTSTACAHHSSPLHRLRDEVRPIGLREAAMIAQHGRLLRPVSRSTSSATTPHATPAGPASLGAERHPLDRGELLVTARGRAWSRSGASMRSFHIPCATGPSSTCADGHVGTPDLLDVEAGVMGQYEGCVPPGRRTARRRRARRGELPPPRDWSASPWRLRPGPSRPGWPSAWRQPGPRSMGSRVGPPWTIEQPSWWIPTHTVELVARALSNERMLGTSGLTDLAG